MSFREQLRTYRQQWLKMGCTPAKLRRLRKETRRIFPALQMCWGSFEWNGQLLEIPLWNRALILNQAPNSTLANWCYNKLLSVASRPNAFVTLETCSYERCAREVYGSYQARAVITPLSQLQAWCVPRGLFDLSAVVVGQANRGAPSDSHYGAHTGAISEWRSYIAQALSVLRQANASLAVWCTGER